MEPFTYGEITLMVLFLVLAMVYGLMLFIFEIFFEDHRWQ